MLVRLPPLEDRFSPAKNFGDFVIKDSGHSSLSVQRMSKVPSLDWKGSLSSITGGEEVSMQYTRNKSWSSVLSCNTA